MGEQFDFGEGLNRLRDGAHVAREGWNGKGMWLALQVPDAHSKMTLPYIYMKTVQGDLVPWLASQTDILATDWESRRSRSIPLKCQLHQALRTTLRNTS